MIPISTRVRLAALVALLAALCGCVESELPLVPPSRAVMPIADGRQMRSNDPKPQTFTLKLVGKSYEMAGDGDKEPFVVTFYPLRDAAPGIYLVQVTKPDKNAEFMYAFARLDFYGLHFEFADCGKLTESEIAKLRLEKGKVTGCKVSTLAQAEAALQLIESRTRLEAKDQLRFVR